MPGAQLKARIQRHTGKNPVEMTNDELDEAINKGRESTFRTKSRIREEPEKPACLRDKGVITDETSEAKRTS